MDINGDRVVDYVYAGDLLGNMWKFNLSDPDPALWDIPYVSGGNPAPLYTAKDQLATPVAQPITSKPEVGRGPQGRGMVVLFGTGKFMEQGDKVPTQTQAFYGLFDPNTNTASRHDRFPLPTSRRSRSSSRRRSPSVR